MVTALTCGHTPGVHVYGRQILDQVEVQLGQAGEQDPGPGLLPAEAHPGVDDAELGEVGALAAHQDRVHIELDALQTELGQPLPRNTQRVREKTKQRKVFHTKRFVVCCKADSPVVFEPG